MWIFNVAFKAINRKLRRIKEAQIDAAFERMGRDEKYLRMTEEVSKQFAKSDWETLKVMEA